MHDGTTVPWTSPCVSGINKYEISYTVSGILWLKYCREIPCTGFSLVSDYETVIRPKMWSRMFRALGHTRELHYGVDYIDPLIVHTNSSYMQRSAPSCYTTLSLYIYDCVYCMGVIGWMGVGEGGRIRPIMTFPLKCGEFQRACGFVDIWYLKCLRLGVPLWDLNSVQSTRKGIIQKSSTLRIVRIWVCHLFAEHKWRLPAVT